MTIKEVARQAGVSPAAVSRYLNGGPVSEEKARKIRAVMEETGFQPNAMARSMRTGQRNQIGIITPRIDSESAAEILEGVTEFLHGSGYGTLLEVSGDRGACEVQCIESLLYQQAAGIILMGTVLRPELRVLLEENKKPIVVTGQRFEGFTCVYHSDYEAVRELARRMLQKGRRAIGYLGVFEDDEAMGKARRLGAEAAWKEAGSTSSLPAALSEGFRPEDGRRAMKTLMEKVPAMDGVICASDQLAVGAMLAIRDAGRQIPGDIAVAGVGDSWVNDATAPPLTSVRLFYRQCGREAARLLMERVKSAEPLPPEQIRLGYEIIERESV